MVCQIWPGIQRTGFSPKKRTELAKARWGLGVLVLQTDGLVCRAGLYFQLGPERHSRKALQKANINPGNNTEAGSRDSSPGAYPACASVKGEAGKDGAWGNRDRDGLEPGSRGGRRCLLVGGELRGRFSAMGWASGRAPDTRV